MESQHLLSNNQFFYLTSQNDKLSDSFNKSQDVKRIQSIVQKAFKTFDLILKSSAIDQEKKNEYFGYEMVTPFLTDLISYNPSNTISEENHKQKIAHKMVTIGLSYYSHRYAKTIFFSEKITEVLQLLEDLESISRLEEEDNKAMQFYKMRKKFEVPPKLNPLPDEWQAICMICWNYTRAKNKEESMKGIRHDIKCPYKAVHGDLDWITRTIPPSKG